jgi:penicillin-binding protein 2
MLKFSRKFFRLIPILVVMILLVACSDSKGSDQQLTPSPLPTITLPPPQVRTTALPNPEETLQRFFEAWKAGDYPTMYALLSPESQATIDLEKFIQLYTEVANQVSISDVIYNLSNKNVSTDQADFDYNVVLDSPLFGQLSTDNHVTLQLLSGLWAIDWSPGLIWPQMAQDWTLRKDLTVPERGQILDRNGQVLAGTEEAAALGIFPDYLDPEKIGSVLGLLSRLTGKPVKAIENMYINYAPGTAPYIPLGEVSTIENKRLIDILSGASGVIVQPYTSRFYPGSGAAPHAVGYVSSIQQGAEADELLGKGYRIDASIGRTGVEAWGEDLLAGKNGAKLYLFDPDGRPQTILGERPLEPSQVITTTLDADLQAGVQQALEGFRGAVVVLERDTGRVLAMASSPGFDPNAYQTNNYNWNSEVASIASNTDLPLFNRATEGQYPLGSVFKLITASAGLESGRFTENSTYDCQYLFTELPDVQLRDWTLTRFELDGVTQPSGLLTLPQGLIRSCNPWFYHIGLDLFNAGLGNSLTDMARGFGLGQATGIEGVPEQAGQVPTPASQLDATNLAIGQGDLLVTPLQVARFVAALGNGGTLYRPQLIEAIGPPGGPAVQVFEPEAVGTLPISEQNLKIIQQAMRGVADSASPRGTAYTTFGNFGIPVYGKTGTATTSDGDPHAWFAGYTGAENPDRPDIAIAVIVENKGDGSVWAAPIFRRVVEWYFNGRAIRPFHWETSIGVIKTPTPYGYEAPTPEPEEP